MSDENASSLCTGVFSGPSSVRFNLPQEGLIHIHRAILFPINTLPIPVQYEIGPIVLDGARASQDRSRQAGPPCSSSL